MPLYSIVDIETTGSRPAPNTITEIAVIITDGKEIKTRFESLLRPSGPIPPFVQRLTGITNEMTEDAPEFGEIADELFEILKDTVFVAHNVNFDYSFLKREFDEVGLDWRSQRLCTVKLTRHFHPGLGKYNLGFLCNYFDVENHAAHRAMGDCEATFQIFKSMIEKFGQEAVDAFFRKQNKAVNLPQALRPDVLNDIPSGAGVYFFKDARGKVIYIGKAVSLVARIRSHFNGNAELGRKLSFIKDIAEIDFILCGNILVASILEDREIKRVRPIHNRAQRELITAYGIYPYKDGNGMERLAIETVKSGGYSDIRFPSQSRAKAWLHNFAVKYEVPPRQLGLPALWSPTSDDLPEKTTLHRDFRQAAADRDEIFFSGRGRSDGESAWVKWVPEVSVTITFTDHDTRCADFDSIFESGQVIGLNPTVEAILSNATQFPHKWGVRLVEIKRTTLGGS